MTPEPGDGQSPRISSSIPTSWETAINDLREARFIQTDRDDPPTKAEIVREAMSLYLAVLKAQDRLPTESFDDVSGIDPQSVLDEYGLTVEGKPEIEIEPVDNRNRGGESEA